MVTYTTKEIKNKITNIIKNHKTNEIPPLFLLKGTLGAGKTTLVKSILPAFKIPSEQITSPTFIILRTYEADNVDLKFAHFDFYRFLNLQNDINKVLNILEEVDFWYYIQEYVTFIEWPSFLENVDLHHKNAYIIDISINNDDRIYKLNKYNSNE